MTRTVEIYDSLVIGGASFARIPSKLIHDLYQGAGRRGSGEAIPKDWLDLRMQGVLEELYNLFRNPEPPTVTIEINTPDNVDMGLDLAKRIVEAATRGTSDPRAAFGVSVSDEKIVGFFPRIGPNQVQVTLLLGGPDLSLEE